jgi:DNA-binding response OmpR family regulator
MFEPSARGIDGHNDPAQAAGQHLLDPDMSGPILVIDDEPYILRSLSYLLAREGYTVETASNGEEGLRRVRSLHPPLVFLDIMMPHMNGYEVCEQVKQDPALEGTYVIMLSAKGQQIDRERGLLGGADEYMTKPFSPREVAQRVRTILAERAAASAA